MHYKNEISNTEKYFRETTGLDSFIKFDDLENHVILI